MLRIRVGVGHRRTNTDTHRVEVRITQRGTITGVDDTSHQSAEMLSLCCLEAIWWQMWLEGMCKGRWAACMCFQWIWAAVSGAIGAIGQNTQLVLMHKLIHHDTLRGERSWMDRMALCVYATIQLVCFAPLRRSSNCQFVLFGSPHTLPLPSLSKLAQHHSSKQRQTFGRRAQTALPNKWKLHEGEELSQLPCSSSETGYYERPPLCLICQCLVCSSSPLLLQPKDALGSEGCTLPWWQHIIA